MTAHDEDVERMAGLLHNTYWHGCKWQNALEAEKGLWRRAARIALTENPAVEALRKLVFAMRQDGVSQTVHAAPAWEHARTVLASLPTKEK